LAIKNPSLQTNQLGKRYNRDWIFRNLSTSFEGGKTYAITGPNGSGKSTLLQVLWGQLPPTEGKLEYTIEDVSIPVEDIYKEVSIATPYLELIEEFTLTELIHFHFSLRKVRDGMQEGDILTRLELTHAKDKIFGNFSSGMRQRVKLALAFFTDSKFLFLDEPCTNLDKGSVDWYTKELSLLPKDCLILIASNTPEEYATASHVLRITDFK
jgi:ABC-type multidrug transport system ATPase subunit